MDKGPILTPTDKSKPINDSVSNNIFMQQVKCFMGRPGDYSRPAVTLQVKKS